jgi:hypothetical protein
MIAGPTLNQQFLLESQLFEKNTFWVILALFAYLKSNTQKIEKNVSHTRKCVAKFNFSCISGSGLLISQQKVKILVAYYTSAQ